MPSAQRWLCVPLSALAHVSSDILMCHWSLTHHQQKTRHADLLDIWTTPKYAVPKCADVWNTVLMQCAHLLFSLSFFYPRVVHGCQTDSGSTPSYALILGQIHDLTLLQEMYSATASVLEIVVVHSQFEALVRQGCYLRAGVCAAC